jgi:uncharacterized protein YlxW (UPF0749 family)
LRTTITVSFMCDAMMKSEKIPLKIVEILHDLNSLAKEKASRIGGAVGLDELMSVLLEEIAEANKNEKDLNREIEEAVQRLRQQKFDFDVSDESNALHKLTDLKKELGRIQAHSKELYNKCEVIEGYWKQLL